MGAANKFLKPRPGYNDRFLKKVHDLSNRVVFPRVHRLVSSPGKFNIYSNVAVHRNQLITYGGETFKISAIHEHPIPVERLIGNITVLTKYYEVSTVCFDRYNKRQ